MNVAFATAREQHGAPYYWSIFIGLFRLSIVILMPNKKKLDYDKESKIDISGKST